MNKSVFVSLGAVVAPLVLSGCGGLATELTRSGFLSSSSSSSLETSRLVSGDETSVSSTGIGQVNIVTGLDDDKGQAVALAQIQGTPNVGTAVATGTATYDASYRYVVLANVRRSSTRITAQRLRESGTLTLTADFDANTLTGSNSDLTVNATVADDGALGGSVTTNFSYVKVFPSFPTAGGFRTSDSLNAEVQGQVGNTGVLGAFHGRDDENVVAGGFVGPKN